MTRLPDGRRGPTYVVWQAMKRRCTSPKVAEFHRYGGRGIKVCERWLTFANFLTDMGERPPGTQIDRVDNDGHYEPGNCRWVPRKANGRNRSDNHLLTLKGETKTIAEWVETTRLSLATIQGRVREGWSDEQILTTPQRARSRNRILTIGDISKPLVEWAKERGVSEATVRHRIAKQGLTPEQALQP